MNDGPAPDSPSDDLIRLADAYGVATDYWDWRGVQRPASAATLRAVLTALGADVSSAPATAASLQRRWDDPWRRLLPPCVVTRSGRPTELYVHVDHGAPVRLWIELEDGGTSDGVTQVDRLVEPRWVDGRLVGEATFSVSGDLPLGYHVLHAQSEGRADAAPLIVTPDVLAPPTERAWGLALQLYSVHSDGSWAQVGDLGDLRELSAWAGRDLGAGFVLVNPLHAAEPTAPMEPSPYLPTSRRFANPLYLRVEDVPELAAADPATRREVERLRESAVGGADTIDRDAAWSAKRAALRLLHRVPRSPERAAQYRAFVEREGAGLVAFGTWCAIVEQHGLDRTDWPPELVDPHGDGVAVFRLLHHEAIEFACWLQLLLDEQLAAVQEAARAAGMRIGVVHDLAVGVHPHGADAWGLGQVLASGIQVGAPPDHFNQSGQNWSQPPWRPDRLADTGYAAYRDLVRTVLRHAGGLRVDHVIGLFRLWWIPAGRPPSEGVYVRYDHDALVGILALEAHRAGAVLIGEDLGVVEPWARDYLCERGILGTSVLWFEYADGVPLPPDRWRDLCLATVTTHDLPPTAGFLAGEHLDLQERLGLLTRPVDEERAAHAAEREAWLAVLRDHGWLGSTADVAATVEALHRAIAHSPARLLAMSLTDAVGDRRTQNQPGTTDEYPNWRVPLTDATGRRLTTADVMASPTVAALAAVMNER